MNKKEKERKQELNERNTSKSQQMEEKLIRTSTA